MQQVNVLQEYFPKDFYGLVDTNHLKSIYMLPDPQSALDHILRLSSVNHGEDFQTFMRRFGTKTFATQDDFRWMLQAESEKNSPLVAAYINGTLVTTADQTGLGNTEFELEFSEPWFSAPAQIVGEYNEVYPIYVKQGPTSFGSNYIYTCELATGNHNLFIPFDQLQAGKKFSQDFNIVETSFSTRGGTVSYSSPFSMKGVFSMLRMEDTRGGDMINRPVAWSWQVMENGRPVTKTLWDEYADWELEQQFQSRVNKFLIYAKANKTAAGTYLQKGDSGRYIVEGAGLHQQMSPSHFYSYNTFSIPWLTDRILSLSVGNIPIDRRKMMVTSGSWGIKQFHESLEDFSTIWSPLHSDLRVTMDKNNNMTYRGTFNKYIGPLGIELTVQLDPTKDNTERNKIMHPSGNGVAESYTYDILNLGSTTDTSNIQICYKKNEEIIYKIMKGLRSPDQLSGTAKNPEVASMTLDAYKIMRATTVGIIVYNPLLTARIVPDILNIS